MTPERWGKIKDNILDNFKVEDKGAMLVDEEGGIDIEYIVFQGPLGRMRLEYITKPVVVDKKTTYSRRIGSDTAVEYVYSEDEKAQMLKVYKWSEDQDDWLEIEADSFK